MPICKRCSQDKPIDNTNTHLCVDCVKAENNRVSHYRRHNYNWLDVAKEADLELWERQPGETDHEYHIWMCYRDAYPGKRPSYRMVAEQLNTTVNAVKKVGGRWSFPTRLQAWAKHVDSITLQQRQQEILDMNKQHVTMANLLNQKIQKAIEILDPYAISPKELSTLMKTATELERKGRLDQVIPATNVFVEEGNTELKKTEVKTENISEILKILGGAGVLNGNNMGVRQTVTTEVVVKGDES